MLAIPIITPVATAIPIRPSGKKKKQKANFNKSLIIKSFSEYSQRCKKISRKLLIVQKSINRHDGIK